MRKISKKLLEEIDRNPRFRTCARSHEGNCKGRITIDHAWIYAGKQVDALWNFVPLCEWHHSVNRYQDNHVYDKEYSEFVAKTYMSDEEYEWYCENSPTFRQKVEYLENKFCG